jgi:hypothetical protein
VNTRLRPKRALSQPVQTIIVVMPTMKAVTTQAIWSGVAEKVPCMWGKEMLTMVRFSE